MAFMFVYTTEIRLLDRVRAASRQRWQIATAIAAAAMIDLLIEAHFHIMYIASVIIFLLSRYYSTFANRPRQW